MLEGLVISVFFFGAFYLVGSWLIKRADRHCPKYRYLYRPQARTFIEEQSDPPSVFKTYQDLFYKVGPWSSTWVNSNERDTGGINPFILGGLPGAQVAGTNRETSDFLNNI
jgi:hypothetical protein